MSYGCIESTRKIPHFIFSPAPSACVIRASGGSGNFRSCLVGEESEGCP